MLFLTIRLSDVTKTFGKGAAAVPALNGVNMTVNAGQLVMLVGPSGCGKTTLLSVISGVLDADHGEAEIFGVEWSRLSIAQKTDRRGEIVGFVFQQFNLIPTLSALDNVATALLVRGFNKRESHERAAHALEQVGLGKRVLSTPAQMSGGMQQRVALARALVGKPRLLVCDELLRRDARRVQRPLRPRHTAGRLQRCYVSGAATSVAAGVPDVGVLTLEHFAAPSASRYDATASPSSPTPTRASARPRWSAAPSSTTSARRRGLSTSKTRSSPSAAATSTARNSSPPTT
jgi:putative ABC transport system ATP-binding protein